MPDSTSGDNIHIVFAYRARMNNSLRHRILYQFVAVICIGTGSLILSIAYITQPKTASAVVKMFSVTNNSSESKVHDCPVCLPAPPLPPLTPTRPVTTAYMLQYTPENIALQLSGCNDSALAAHSKYSKISLTNRKVRHPGDTIIVNIKLYDGYDKPITKGGAILRARMFNWHSESYATGPVTDHGNGSYTAYFEAVWLGVSTIKVRISYTPETIRALYHVRQVTRGTFELGGIFSVGPYEERTKCHPTYEALINCNYSHICNLTGDNSGMPWFCGKPTDVHLLCEDWTAVFTPPFPPLPYTPCEAELFDRSQVDISQALNMVVLNKPGSTAPKTEPDTLCRDFNLASLWTRQEPTGFMHNGRWQLRHCKGPDKGALFSCLKDRKIMLLGDSTIRQWFDYIKNSWGCVHSSEYWTQNKWHKRAACENNQHNFTVLWLPHSQPFFYNDLARYTTTSVSRYLDEIGNNEKVIALIHLYQHATFYHHIVFRRKIQRIRASVEHLLNRNKFAKVLIKGPHTYTHDEGTDVTARTSDYYSLVYRHILYEEFAGLHDKIVYLDNSDITNARAEKDRHPSGGVVAAMVEQMVAYMC